MQTSLAGLEAGLADRLHHDVERFLVRLEVRREAALVADAGGEAALLQDAAQRVEDLGADAQRLAERAGADRHHHELLEVDVAVGVRAAVEDVHHRHGQQVGALAADHRVAQRADVLVERHLLLGRGGAQGGHRHAERSRWRRGGPCSAVPSRAIIASSSEAWSNSLPTIACAISPLMLATAVRTPLPEIAALVAVAQLERLARPGRRPRGHRRAAEGAAVELTSTSTVGLPRESRISRPTTRLMFTECSSMMQ